MIYLQYFFMYLAGSAGLLPCAIRFQVSSSLASTGAGGQQLGPKNARSILELSRTQEIHTGNLCLVHFFIILHPFFPGDPIKSSVLTFVSPWLALHAGHPGGILSAAEIVAEIRPEVSPPTSSMIRRALYSFKRQFQVPAECAATDIPIQRQKSPWISYFPVLVWKIDWEACMWLGNAIVSQPSGYSIFFILYVVFMSPCWWDKTSSCRLKTILCWLIRQFGSIWYILTKLKLKGFLCFFWYRPLPVKMVVSRKVALDPILGTTNTPPASHGEPRDSSAPRMPEAPRLAAAGGLSNLSTQRCRKNVIENIILKH